MQQDPNSPITPGRRLSLRLGLALFAAACGAASRASDRSSYNLGDRLPAKPPAGRAAAAYRDLAWEDLVPPGWDPMKGFDMKEIANLSDGDPRAKTFLDQLRRAWDNAPARRELNDTRVRMPGFVVSLGTEGRKLREFLLVPYFGACVHSPPPPSNQVVHVVMDRAASGIGMMDAVWVKGRLRVTSFSSEMGAASYRIDGEDVAPYR
jgi:hypothetical protein